MQDFGSSGAWHTGALDFYDGHVYLPISYHNPDRSYIFAFDRQLEWKQQYDPVGDASWVAINPVDGFIYGSSFYGPPPYLCPPMIRVSEMLFVPGVTGFWLTDPSVVAMSIGGGNGLVILSRLGPGTTQIFWNDVPGPVLAVE